MLDIHCDRTQSSHQMVKFFSSCRYQYKYIESIKQVSKQQKIDMSIPSTETCLFHGSWGQWVSPGVSLNRVIGYTGGRYPPHSCHAQQSQGYDNVCSEVNEESADL